MGFLSVEIKEQVAAKKPAPGRRTTALPMHSIAAMGCRACPREASCSKLAHPFMEFSGSEAPEILVVWEAPTLDDDHVGQYGSTEAGRVISSSLRQLGVRFAQTGLLNCAGTEPPSDIEMAACRQRLVRLIKSMRPRVILAVGDRPWHALSGLNGALTFRGLRKPVAFDGHDAWVFCVAFPKFVSKRNGAGSPHGMVFRADLEEAAALATSREVPVIHSSGYDSGLELITGEEPGDLVRLEEALHWLLAQPRVGLDYETNCLRPSHEANPLILTAALATFERGVAFPVDHPLGWGTMTRQKRVRGALGEFLMQSGRKVAHNLSFEAEWTHHYWGPSPLFLSEWECTQAQGYVLDGRQGINSLEVRTQLMFGFNLKAQSPVDPSVGILKFPLRQVLRYNGMDSKWCEALFRVQEPLVRECGLQDTYEHRIRMAGPLAATQAKGVPVDVTYAAKYDGELAGEMAEVERKLRNCPEIRQYERERGSRLDPGNSNHVLDLLVKICKRPEARREDFDGNVSWSSDEDVLGAIPAEDMPSAALILRYRSLDKLRGTYLAPIVSGRVISPWDGRIHCQYSPIRTLTSRLACEDPNLQNIPTRTAEGRKIRGAIPAERGGLIVAADYGQIEARVVGMASQDPNLMRYQWSNYDIHGDWAKRIVAKYGRIKDWIVATFGVDWDEKGAKTLRQEMKNKWVFPMFFGARAESCAADLHIPLDIAEDLKAEFWDEFRGVERWQEELVAFYARHQYVETLDGFRRRGVMTRNEIINMPVQGTAARIVTTAQAALSEIAFVRDDLLIVPNLNVHDDLSFWMPDDDELAGRIELVATEMCRHRFDFITVPLIVEVKVGQRWDQLEEVAVFRSNELFNLENPFS